jgi:phosphatidylglycerophosphatase C
MGTTDESRQPQSPFRPIVAFDFDGTLTTRDSFTAFLAWRAGAGRYAAGLVRLAPSAFLYLFHRDRGRIKAAAARAFLVGMSQNEMAAEARRFAEGYARKLLRPDAMRSWKRWQGEGARMVIVTASPETIVAPFARGLGADVLIATELEFDSDGLFTGRLAGPNCRGEEKVRRLREVFGPDLHLEAAYGDTSGDKEMLALADEDGFRVFRGSP